MDLKIIQLETTYLAGISFYGDPFATSAGWTHENEIGQLWDRFIKILTAHQGMEGPVFRT